MSKVSVMIEGGKATAAAPLGPALGPLGVDVGAIVDKINEKTATFNGMKVPVEIEVNSDKTFEVSVGTPPMSALIKKELNLQKAAGNPKTEKAGNISLEQVKNIAKSKQDSLSSYKLKSSVKEVVGTCDSMGIYVEGKKASEFIKDIESGQYDSQLQE